ncbi:MAG: beta-ketoacyl-ACP synthase II [Armatimonadota bacterium]|nr:beta-ketoacyl-ACP synthase II [Armatimonadota bacterium]MDR7551068.1 beta-ketoacyl-ACP synthase II [Armatimonadota bacterium]
MSVPRGEVVVTGLGAVTPVGLTAAETWQALCAGRSGVGRITLFDPSALPVQIAAEVKGFDPAPYVDARSAGRLERFTVFALAASIQAMADAGLRMNDADPDRIGVVMNTGGGGMSLVERETAVLAERGPRRVSPLFVPMMMPNIGACQISISLGLRGPVITSTAACAAGVQAVVDALRLIRDGEADVIIAGGSEAALTALALSGMANMRALSRRNHEPERASRPFDADREGFVFGEGAVALVLERRAHAEARGARPYAAVLGGAATADAYHITAPDPEGRGAARAMTLALQSAGLAPEDIDYICAHATSTPIGDVAEVRAIRQTFGAHADRVAVSSPKSMVGHLMGAAGALSSLVAVKAIHEGIIPPTINLDRQDPACDLDCVPNVARRAAVRAAIANGFGFGGQNIVAVFARP